MKTLVIYYSYGGKTRRLAQALAKELGADLCEVKDIKRPGVAFFRVPAAVMQKTAKIQPITADLAAYEKIILMGPIWAGHPAPPVNNVIEALPAGANVELRMVSAGGSSERNKVIEKVKATGATVIGYIDVQGSAANAAESTPQQ